MIPRLEIRQTYAAIGIETERGAFEIRQPHARVNPETEPAKLLIDREPARVEVNADKAWDALAQGSPHETFLRIYSAGPQALLEHIAYIAELGDRFAAIHIPEDPFAEAAADWNRPIRIADAVAGSANYDNVEITFIPEQLNFDFQPAQVRFDPYTSKAEIEYHRGKVHIYLRQRNSIEIRVVGLDARV